MPSPPDIGRDDVAGLARTFPDGWGCSLILCHLHFHPLYKLDGLFKTHEGQGSHSGSSKDNLKVISS